MCLHGAHAKGAAGVWPKGCIGPANSTNSTYCFNTNLTNFNDAEAYCNGLCGHLVSWNSQAEQTEVGA